LRTLRSDPKQQQQQRQQQWNNNQFQQKRGKQQQQQQHKRERQHNLAKQLNDQKKVKKNTQAVFPYSDMIEKNCSFVK
jgi:hypothetical protein